MGEHYLFAYGNSEGVTPNTGAFFLMPTQEQAEACIIRDKSSLDYIAIVEENDIIRPTKSNPLKLNHSMPNTATSSGLPPVLLRRLTD